MNELSLQRDVVKEVRNRGGFAFKMSNRFLVGVADLFVKLPDLPAAFFEVKLQKAPVKSNIVKLKVTTLQQKFLRKAENSGMTTGILSFVIVPDKYMCISIVRHEHKTQPFGQYTLSKFYIKDSVDLMLIYLQQRNAP